MHVLRIYVYTSLYIDVILHHNNCVHAFQYNEVSVTYRLNSASGGRSVRPSQGGVYSCRRITVER